MPSTPYFNNFKTETRPRPQNVESEDEEMDVEIVEEIVRPKVEEIVIRPNVEEIVRPNDDNDCDVEVIEPVREQQIIPADDFLIASLQVNGESMIGSIF